MNLPCRDMPFWSCLLMLLSALFGSSLPAATGPVAHSRKPPSPSPPRLVLQTGHSDAVTALAVSETWVVTGGADGFAFCWDHSGAPKATLRHGAPITSLAISPNGTVATAGTEGRVVLWQPKTGRSLRAFAAEGNLQKVAFSQDGTLLCAGAMERGAVSVWNVASGKLIAELLDLRDCVTALKVSPNGKWLAGSGKGRLAAVWSLPDCKLRAVLKGHQHSVTDLAWAADSLSIVTSSLDGTARVWDAASGAPRRVLESVDHPLTCLDVASNGKLVAAGSLDGTVAAWELPGGKSHAQYPGHRSGLTAVRFSPDGRRLATACQDWTVRVWNANDAGPAKPAHEFTNHRDEVLALEFFRDGNRLITGGKDRSARIWSLASASQVAVLGIPPPSQITAVATGGTRIVTGALDGSVRVWSTETGRLERAFPPVEDALTRTTRSAVSALALSPDGAMVAVGRWGEVQILDGVSGKLLTRLEDENDWVRAIAFSPSGDRVATGGDDLRVRLYARQSAAFTSIQTTLAHRLPVSHLTFGPNGKLLASGGQDGDVRIWDDRTGKSIGEPLRTHWITEVTALAFSTDGREICRAAGQELASWDVASGEALRAFQTRAERLTRLEFNSSGGILQGLDQRGRIWLWAGMTEIPAAERAKVSWSSFSASARVVFSHAGSALSLHSPASGKILATLLPMPDQREEDYFAERVRPRNPLSSPTPRNLRVWFVSTPQGYYDCSLDADRYVLWNVDGTVHPVERYRKRFYRPAHVAWALAEKPVPDPEPAALTQPPRISFLSPDAAASCRAGDALSVSLLVVDDGTAPPTVSLSVNGRPLDPESHRLPSVASKGNGKPIVAVDKPIVVIDKPIVAVDKPIVVVDKPTVAVNNAVETVEPTRERRVGGWVFTYRLRVPTYSERLFISAVAVDGGSVGSDRVERELPVRLSRPAAGALHVLSVGVSTYLNGSKTGAPDKIRNLNFADFDALCVERRFLLEGRSGREGSALYNAVETRTLINQAATATAIREELRRIRKAVNPAGTDTVVLYLSGHGLNGKDGFRFGTYEADLQRIEATTLSGTELLNLLDSGLRARQVFVFIDSCHAGAVPARNEEFVRTLQDRVRICASSSALENSFESPEWKHGAFTLALLKALQGSGKRPTISLLDLMADIAAEVQSLLEEAGRHPEEQMPNMPVGQRNAIIARAEPDSLELITNPPK